MPKIIEQRVLFDVASSVLYNLYMDEQEHTAVTEAQTFIKKIEGSEFSAYDGYIQGKNLVLIPNKLIVQSWRGKDWGKDDPDSILVIELNVMKKKTELHMVHVNVPEKFSSHIAKGWKEHYWNKWKQFLKLK